MLSQDDIDKLKKASELLSDVSQRIDCDVCRSHVDVAISMVDDLTDISKLQIAYRSDPKALDRLTELIQDERTLRILAIGSKFLALYRKISRKIYKID